MTRLETSGSVTRWIEEIKLGSEKSVTDVWNRYFSQLAVIADSKLFSLSSRSLDGEDVALSVIETVCRKAAVGQYPDIRHRDDLWLLLLAITHCRVISHKRHELRQKRGGGRVSLETDVRVFQNAAFDLNQIPDGEPNPDLLVDLMDACDHLVLQSLQNDMTKEVATLKLEGLTNAEIAKKLDISERTVERKIKLIRSVWISEIDDDPADESLVDEILEGGSHDSNTDR